MMAARFLAFLLTVGPRVGFTFCSTEPGANPSKLPGQSPVSLVITHRYTVHTLTFAWGCVKNARLSLVQTHQSCLGSHLFVEYTWRYTCRTTLDQCREGKKCIVLLRCSVMTNARTGLWRVATMHHIAAKYICTAARTSNGKEDWDTRVNPTGQMKLCLSKVRKVKFGM